MSVVPSTGTHCSRDAVVRNLDCSISDMVGDKAMRFPSKVVVGGLPRSSTAVTILAACTILLHIGPKRGERYGISLTENQQKGKIMSV